jgi:DNA helicase-2/ATP-dependent DNA helicase PcrA
VVSDFEQSVYGWRGSNPELMYGFDAQYNPEIIKQTVNYRSTHEIVAVANQLIKNHMNAYTVLMEATRSGKPVEVNFYDDIGDEVQSITKHLRRTL